jgi:hypothetical protein
MNINNNKSKDKKIYKFNETINVPSEFVNIVIGKQFKNINNIRCLSPEVTVFFSSNKKINKSLFIIKSNNKLEFDRIKNEIYNLINNSYNIYMNIKKKEKENKYIKKKLREIRIKTEISKKIETEMEKKKIEKIKSSYIENNSDNNDELYNKNKSKNPFSSLDIE